MVYVKKVLSEDDKNALRANLFMNRMKLSPDPVCDFCGDRNPLFMYGAKRLTTGEEQRCWRWCACKRCSILVDARAWTLLAQRIADMLAQIMPINPGMDTLLQSANLALNTFKRDALLDD